MWLCCNGPRPGEEQALWDIPRTPALGQVPSLWDRALTDVRHHHRVKKNSTTTIRFRVRRISMLYIYMCMRKKLILFSMWKHNISM